MIYPNLNVAPSKPDSRDRVYSFKQSQLPDTVDLRQYDSPVESQGNLGSCVGNAMTNAYELMVNEIDRTKFQELSRLYVYYHSRYIEGTVPKDAGVTYLRNALKAVQTFGICTEVLWPYDIQNFALQPYPECYVDGCSRKLTLYERIQTIDGMCNALANNRPIIIGTVIFEGFMALNRDDATIKMPTSIDYEIGGHSVVILGYSLPEKKFLVKNSFGDDWGDGGYCWMPFEYVERYVFESWTFSI